MKDIIRIYIQYILTEGNLEVKLPTRRTDGKAEVGRVREEKSKERRSEKRKSEKKMSVREKIGKSRFTVFFQCDLWVGRVEK
jgi:hypothetical protein